MEVDSLEHGDAQRVSDRATVSSMASRQTRINVSLDPAYAEKLTILARRAHLHEGTLARSLLSQAIDAADIDARSVIELLDGIPGAFERAERGIEQIRAGEGIPLDRL